MPEIHLRGIPTVPTEERAAHVAYARSLGLPGIPAVPKRLAVVGSGHSLPAYEETLRRWPGAIWACNGAFPWLKARGIPSTFFTVHPTDSVLKHLGCLEKGDRVILAEQCCPEVYQRAISAGAIIVTFDDLISPCIASATHAAFHGIAVGFTEVTFFGSDLNFSEGKQYLNDSGGFRPLMLVRAGGEDYMTTPAYYAQAKEMIQLIQTAPKVFRERSAGLLRAMLEGPSEVIWLSDEVLQMKDPLLVGAGFPAGQWQDITVSVSGFTVDTGVEVVETEPEQFADVAAE